MSKRSSGTPNGLKWVLAAGLFLLLVWCLAPSRRQPVEPVEAGLNDLVRIEGRLCLKEGSRPFTGHMVERYDSGALKTRSAIREGLMDGISEGWFTNGVLQIREPFRKGVTHGLRTKWHSNGTKLSEAVVADGKLDGVFRRWNEDGTLLQEIQMKQGEPDGISRAYFPSGFLKTEVLMAHGNVVRRSSWNDREFKEPPLAPQTD